MLVVAGLDQLGIFKLIGQWMIDQTATARGLALAFVLLCFFLSMAITNDVALITFVPFAMEVLVMSGLTKYMIRLIVLETIAANLGSMLTPLGNPQNLFLYSLSGIPMEKFVRITLPYALCALVLLVLATVLLIGKDATENETGSVSVNRDGRWKMHLFLYLMLFAVCMLTVFRVLPYYVSLMIVVAVVCVLNYRILARADYGLLCTFVFLFVFIGNLGRVPAISHWLMKLVDGREVLAGVLASQVISNVPAAILLSGFTDNFRALIVGVNLGGLGTLIASMASLISFKCYCNDKDSQEGRYLLVFSGMNVVFLIALVGLYCVLG